MKMIHNEAEMIAYLQSLHYKEQEAQRIEAQINNETMVTGMSEHTYPLQVKLMSKGGPVLNIVLNNGVEWNYLLE